MRYLTAVASMRMGKTLDGKTIPCNYQSHPRFSQACDLCAGLHYAFIRFVGGRTYSKGYELRTAINYFLDYAVEYENGNPKELRLTGLLQVSAEVFIGYDLFIKRKKGPKLLATRLKTALSMVANEYDEGLPRLALPLLDDPSEQPYEPLTEECFQQLSDALKRHIDLVYEKIEFRRVIEAARPYTNEEVNGSGRSLHTWVPEDDRAIKTLILHGHPFVVPFDNFVGALSNARGKDPVSNVVELIYRRYNNGPLIRRAGAKKLSSLAEVFQSYYPTAIDQAAIAVFIALQTGWNKETVMAIDGDNFEHPLTGALRSSQALLVSEKQKSQSNRKPYLDPKTFLAPSSKQDKYSAYSLINLAKALAHPLSELPADCASEREIEDHCHLWLCMRHFAIMTHTTSTARNRPGRFISVANQSSWLDGVKGFFEKYEIRENGTRLASANDIRGRLRPTWIRYVRDKKDRPLSLVALQQGHERIETTDVHYDSSGPAMQQRRERLRSELSDVANLLRQRKFKGMLGKKGIDAVSRASLRIFTIPGHERSLWACTDSFKPDWPSSASRIPFGAKCSEISQCLFCSRVCIFEDSLPFLMDRQATIQRELGDGRKPAFSSPLDDELRIIEYILDEWGDEQALKRSAWYLRQHPNMLPRDMHSLSILFED